MPVDSSALIEEDDGRVTALPLARGQGVAAWRQIADEIEADIAAGRLAPGAQLPTEAKLAARFAVNRHTVRRAIAVLAAKGLLRATQGRGTFVEAKPLAYPIGRRTRFTEIVTREGHEAGGELISAVETAADEHVASILRIAVGAPVLETEMRRFVDGTPVSFGTSFFPLPRFAGMAAALRDTGSITRALAACGVPDYMRAETRISARLATVEDAARLDLSPGRILLVVDGVNVDAAGVPIQATRAFFAADRVELRVAG
ncbi:phosphonate metabolism transcriptional regulator PhnF [Chelatococcus sp. SYSU_G07232]|uniref:Phosphonate metabolism transcriptional regulator PhnF n=2 Tax=Chelatococcus albus TaxID=3047466 RepID=A0ABT7AI98_9HYPH|nr:phosphonate metabolism transcriptional regulator PhnF [Chelatococcus sp. SYSU_G07232]MDJ1159107.1 phosphonate metabolism transcriptional regulator PhnF [Chelatococcus sp. SYSU_G07232]